MKVKLSDYVWEHIAKQGIRHVFMFPGGGAMHLVDSLGKNRELKQVTLMHEQACAMAAETYARMTYGLSAILVTTGPGGTNAVTGVAAAWLESTPMIIISGQVKTADLKGDSGVRQRGNQEIGITELVSSITKYAVTVTEPNEILYHLQRATYEATNGRPGPVWVDIPLDVQGCIIETEQLTPYIDEKTGAETQMELRSNAKRINELLVKAERPVFIVGQGLERSNGKEAFRELVDKLRIPVLTSWIGTEILQHDHEMNMGKPGMIAARYSNFAMQNADLIIALGTRLDSAMIGYNPDEFAPKAKKVIVDIDMHELEKFNFPVELKINADAAAVVKMLLDIPFAENDRKNKIDWIQKCKIWKNTYPIQQEVYRYGEEWVNPYYFVDKLSEMLEDNDVIIPGSSGAGIDIFWLTIKNRKEQRLLATGSLGSMGYGIPASIGAALASNKRTICVEGDGSLQLNIQELASIKGMALPIKIFVLNNGGYLSIMNMQKNHFRSHFVGSNPESGLHLPDISAVATAYGLKTYEIRRHLDLEEMIDKTLKADGPALCNVYIDPSCEIQPKVMSRVDTNGSMISGKLEDLYPFLT